MGEALVVLALGNLCQKDQEQWPNTGNWGPYPCFFVDKVMINSIASEWEVNTVQPHHLRVNVSGYVWRGVRF